MFTRSLLSGAYSLPPRSLTSRGATLWEEVSAFPAALAPGWSALAAAAVMVFQLKEHTAMASPTLVRSEAQQALRQSPHPALRRLSVEETEATIVITGNVPS